MAHLVEFWTPPPSVSGEHPHFLVTHRLAENGPMCQHGLRGWKEVP